MWRFKYLLTGMLISGALGAVLFFVGRYVYDEFRAELEEDAVAAVDDYFRDNDLPPVTTERIVLDEQDLSLALRRADAASAAFDEEGLAVDLAPGEIRIVDVDQGGDLTNLASVSPQIVKGRIELGDPDGVVAIFVPMGTIADEIELQVFNYFNENDVTPTRVEVTDRELIVTVEPKPGTTLATPRAATPGAATPTARAAATPSPRAGARTPTAVATPTPTPRTTETAVVRATAVGTVPAASTPTPRAGQPTATRTGPRTPTPTP